MVEQEACILKLKSFLLHSCYIYPVKKYTMIKFGISTLILIFTMFSSFPLFAGLSDDNKGVSNPKTATITSSGGDIEIAVEKTDLQPNEFRGSFVLSYTLSDQKGREIESDFFVSMLRSMR